MLNLTKISKDEEIKLVHFINKRKSLAKFLFFICTFSWLLFLCILLAKTKECVFARHNCLTSYFLLETYTLNRTGLHIINVSPIFRV